MFTKFALAVLLFDPSQEEQYATITDSQGIKHTGTIQGVMREDGSGSSFNVTMREMKTGFNTTFHVRTID